MWHTITVEQKTTWQKIKDVLILHGYVLFAALVLYYCVGASNFQALVRWVKHE